MKTPITIRMQGRPPLTNGHSSKQPPEIVAVVWPKFATEFKIGDTTVTLMRDDLRNFLSAIILADESLGPDEPPPVAQG